MSSTEFNLIGSSFFRKGNIANAKFNYFLGLKKDPYNAELLSNFNLTSEATYENSEERKKHLLLVLVFILLVAFNLSFFLFPILRRKKAFIILYTFLLGFSFYLCQNL